ncbi:MAG: HAD family hydrolase [Deltaproteobacteria bacterium]|nr:HAD family hydrolase [Deltaproteobacteria bacterium]
MSVKLLITDLDHTLWDWAGYIVPSLKVMVDSVETTTGYPRPFIIEALKKVYGRYQTTEYAFTLQQSAIWTRWRRQHGDDLDRFLETVVTPAALAYAAERKKRFRLYPGVKETLEKLKRQGVSIVALSDAPRFPAEQRLKRAGIDSLFDGLYCLKSYPIPKSGGRHRVAPFIVAKERSGHYRSQVGKVIELPPSWEKPDPRGLRKILKAIGVKPEEAILVGDSLRKDGAVAHTAGVPFYWARYGTEIPAKILEELSLYTPAAVRRRNSSPPAGEVHRKGELVSFRDILRLQ